MSNLNKKIFRAAIAAISAGFIFYGVSRGEVEIIFKKAVHICLECVGIG